MKETKIPPICHVNGRITLFVKDANEVCKNGQGSDQCKFLGRCPESSEHFYCLKTIPHMRKIVEEEYQDFVNYCMQEQKAIQQYDLPLGDHCPGQGVR